METPVAGTVYRNPNRTSMIVTEVIGDDIMALILTAFGVVGGNVAMPWAKVHADWVAVAPSIGDKLT